MAGGLLTASRKRARTFSRDLTRFCRCLKAGWHLLRRVHSVFAPRDGEPLRGVWYDRTGLCLAGRRKDDESSLEDFASEEILHLDPLPCWEKEGLSA